ncbi:NTP transferase domain-containing protein [Candidatus Pacearchaeota archaeon]|nr:NTP transferase domain-containing protein [Candidatus Pacearchaeota archaeon]
MDKKDVKVVILCGGKGTRLREVSELVPKPLVPIGKMPIVWHIMKGYASQGYKNFILCLGYKGDLIRNFFLNYADHNHEITVNLKSGEITERKGETEDWNVTLVDTGEETNTGARLYAVRKYIENDPCFMLTYGDGISDINLDKLLEYHLLVGASGTITGIRASSKYGQVKTDEKGIAIHFAQYPLLDERINGGFMILNKDFLDHPLLKLNLPIEDSLEDLTRHRKIAVYLHNGAWFCMDTPQHFEHLNQLWKSGNAPWKIWQ